MSDKPGTDDASPVRGSVDRITEGVAVILLDDGTQLEIAMDELDEPLAEGDIVEAVRVASWQVRRVAGASDEQRAALGRRLGALRSRSARFGR